MKTGHTHLFLTITLFCILAGCENPANGSFERDNPSDPESEEFIPLATGQLELVTEQAAMNEINISWPLFFGVEKYRLLRSQDDKKSFRVLNEFEEFRDTSYVDKIQESGSYFYKVEAIGKNGAIHSVESNRVLSNWVELSVVSENTGIAMSSAYSALIHDHKVFVHFFTSDRGGYFSIFDIITGEWSNISLQNYADLVIQRRFIRSNQVVFLSETEFLLFDVFNENDTGSGPWQEFLGVVCNITDSSCKAVGTNALEKRYYYNDVVHTKISGNRYFITGEISSIYSQFAYILNGDDFSITKVETPLYDKHPTTLTMMKNGDVLACGERGYNSYPQRNHCQRLDPITRKWILTKEMPLKYNSLTSYLLSDGRVFINSESEERRSMIYNPTNDSWTVTAESEFGISKEFGSFHKGIRTFFFKNLIFETNEGSILNLKYTTERLSGPFGNYIIEEYFPYLNQWSKPIRLPDHVRYLYTAIKVPDDRILFIYRSEESTKIKSAYLYF